MSASLAGLTAKFRPWLAIAPVLCPDQDKGHELSSSRPSRSDLLARHALGRLMAGEKVRAVVGENVMDAHPERLPTSRYIRATARTHGFSRAKQSARPRGIMSSGLP